LSRSQEFPSLNSSSILKTLLSIVVHLCVYYTIMKFAIIAVSAILLSFVGSSLAQTRAGQSAQQLCRNNNSKNGGLFPHEEYCDYYYECDSSTGEAVIQACPNGLAFSGHRRGLVTNCDYPHRVGCPDGTRVMGQQPINSDNCQWQYGVFPHATSCTRYWHCWNGTSTIQQCPFSLLYNDVLHSCDWPDNVPDCQKHPICKDTPNGPVLIEKSCVRYWLCVGGYPRLQRCPAGLAFNPTTLRCELATTVPGCEPPPTTAPPEEEEEESQGNNNNNNNNNANANSNTAARPQPQGPAPQQFRPSQGGVRLVGK